MSLSNSVNKAVTDRKAGDAALLEGAALLAENRLPIRPCLALDRLEQGCAAARNRNAPELDTHRKAVHQP